MVFQAQNCHCFYGCFLWSYFMINRYYCLDILFYILSPILYKQWYKSKGYVFFTKMYKLKYFKKDQITMELSTISLVILWHSTKIKLSLNSTWKTSASIAIPRGKRSLQMYLETDSDTCEEQIMSIVHLVVTFPFY